MGQPEHDAKAGIRRGPAEVAGEARSSPDGGTSLTEEGMGFAEEALDNGRLDPGGVQRRMLGAGGFRPNEAVGAAATRREVGRLGGSATPPETPSLRDGLGSLQCFEKV